LPEVYLRNLNAEETMAEETTINQYLTFTVSGDTYAISVSYIREVLEFQTVSKIPRMPDFMRGIINLRGSVIPVIDLKTKFGLGITEKDVKTSVVVSEVRIGTEEIVIGLLTDSVCEVLDIATEDIDPPPHIGTTVDASFIKGMGKNGEDFIIILDIGQVLSSDELSQVASVPTNEAVIQETEQSVPTETAEATQT